MRVTTLLLGMAIGISGWATGLPRVPYTEITFLFTSSAALVGELRGVEARCACGRVVSVEEWIDYTSRGPVQAFAFDPLEPKLYLVGPGSGEIRCVYYSLLGPLGEWTLYRHDRPVTDLAARAEGGRSAIYFSSVDPGSGEGAVYCLSQGGDIRLEAAISFDPAVDWWDGFFAFDPSGALYLSSGGRLPGRLYRVEDGRPLEVARIPARRIGGFLFLGPWVVLYSDLAGGVWKLDLRWGEPVPVYSSRGRFRISDVGLYPDWWEELSRGW